MNLCPFFSYLYLAHTCPTIYVYKSLAGPYIYLQGAAIIGAHCLEGQNKIAPHKRYTNELFCLISKVSLYSLCANLYATVRLGALKLRYEIEQKEQNRGNRLENESEQQAILPSVSSLCAHLWLQPERIGAYVPFFILQTHRVQEPTHHISVCIEMTAVAAGMVYLG